MTNIQPRDITTRITDISHYPVKSGGFANIHIGHFEQDSGQVIKVAVKNIRSKSRDGDRANKRIELEFHLSEILDHENVLQCYGTCLMTGCYGYTEVAIVTPWQANGDILTYLKNKKGTISTSLRFKLLCDVLEGLRYLHQKKIVHGDLSSANVLIKDNGVACICDFGLSKIVNETLGIPVSSSSALKGTTHYMPPEAWRIEDVVTSDSRRTEKWDIYSFGCLAMEVLTGAKPFNGISRKHVIGNLARGIVPEFPQSDMITEEQRVFIQTCCDPNPSVRPSASVLLERFRAFRRDSFQV